MKDYFTLTPNSKSIPNVNFNFCSKTYFRALGTSGNPEERVVRCGANLPPLVEIGLTEFQKKEAISLPDPTVSDSPVLDYMSGAQLAPLTYSL